MSLSKDLSTLQKLLTKEHKKWQTAEPSNSVHRGEVTVKKSDEEFDDCSQKLQNSLRMKSDEETNI